MNAPIRTYRPLWRRLLDRVAASHRRTRLQELDARTLADIGVHPSELSLIDAEAHGQAGLTRRRIVPARLQQA